MPREVETAVVGEIYHISMACASGGSAPPLTFGIHWATIRSLRLRIVSGPHLAIRACGADLHFGRGDLMEKVGSAPAVAHLPLAVHM